jgi:hypothetical protein
MGQEIHVSVKLNNATTVTLGKGVRKKEMTRIA